MTYQPDIASPELHRFIRSAAEQHAEQVRRRVPFLLRSMPASSGKPSDLHAALDLLAASCKDAARACIGEPEGSTAKSYGAALLGYALALEVFLFETEPEDPRRAAVYFITYVLSHRDQYASTTPEAAAFLKQSDAGEFTPEGAHAALSSFPSVSMLGGFLATHHVDALALEALTDPEDFHPRKALAESLEVLHCAVHTVTPPQSAEA